MLDKCEKMLVRAWAVSEESVCSFFAGEICEACVERRGLTEEDLLATYREARLYLGQWRRKQTLLLKKARRGAL
jgi:hypothetical protein